MMDRRALAIGMKRHWQMYVFAFLPIVYLVVFRYVPMLGIQIAFKNFTMAGGIYGSEWVGLFQFQKFFETYQFQRVVVNTITLSFYSLLAGFPLPIALALMMNALRSKRFRSTVRLSTFDFRHSRVGAFVRNRFDTLTLYHDKVSILRAFILYLAKAYIPPVPRLPVALATGFCVCIHSALREYPKIRCKCLF